MTFNLLKSSSKFKIPLQTRFEGKTTTRKLCLVKTSSKPKQIGMINLLLPKCSKLALKRKTTSAQILPTMEIVSTGYNPRSVSAPRRIASLPAKSGNQLDKLYMKLW